MRMTKCELCNKQKKMINVQPIGYICSGCIVILQEKLTKALDLLYDKFIYPIESKYILENLMNKDFDLDDYMENNKNYSEEIMFQVIADLLDGKTDREVEKMIFKKADIKKVIMDFDDNDESR